MYCNPFLSAPIIVLCVVAESVKEGIAQAGGSSTIYQYVHLLVSLTHPPNPSSSTRIPETLPADVLSKMGAPPKPGYPVISAEELKDFDAFLFGIPTRYGNFPAQWKVRPVDPVGSVVLPLS